MIHQRSIVLATVRRYSDTSLVRVYRIKMSKRKSPLGQRERQRSKSCDLTRLNLTGYVDRRCVGVCLVCYTCTYLRGSSDRWQVCCGKFSAGAVADVSLAVVGFNPALVSLDCGASLLTHHSSAV